MPRMLNGAGMETSSAEFRRLELIVRLDDLAQAIFQRAVAAIGVRVVALHEFLEPRLDLARGRIDLQSQRIERLALGVAHRARLRRRTLHSRTRPSSELTHHLERIVRAVRVEPVYPAIEAHLPSRAMAGDGILLIPRDCVLAHAGEIVVGMVVFAHMLEAEAPVFPLAQSPLWRAVRRLKIAAWPLAHRRLPTRPAILLGLDPDPIEQRRV